MLWSSWCKNQNYAIRGFRLAALLGQNSDDPEEVIEFLRKVPAEDIVKVQPNILTVEVSRRFFLYPFHDYDTNNQLEWNILIIIIGKIRLRDSFRGQLRRNSGRSCYARTYRSITEDKRWRHPRNDLLHGGRMHSVRKR